MMAAMSVSSVGYEPEPVSEQVLCPRRSSYAGLSLAHQQKLRRVSLAVISDAQDSGQQHQHQLLQETLKQAQHRKLSSSVNSSCNCSLNSGSSCASTSTPNSNNSSTSTMLPSSYESVISRSSGINMDMSSSRINRRNKPANSETFTCSQQSILSAMDRFVKCVNNMDSTVLVPSKLRDMDLTSGKVMQRIPPALANTDLHSFYIMLNEVKKELLWGPGSAASAVATAMVPMSGRSSPRELKHIRQPSDDSLGSMGSTASSSASDQETDSDADSMMTDRDSIDEHTSHLAAAFRHHLQGLHTILHQLADSADYLSLRYQEEIDVSSL